MQNLIKKYQPHFGITQGCRVGMRNPKNQQLMKKGWKIMTTSKKLATTMDMPCLCPRDYQHAPCEGGLAGTTAYYTPDFVKRVVQGMMLEVTHNMLVDELHGKTVLPTMFGEGGTCVCDTLKEHGCQLTCGHCQHEHDMWRPKHSRKEHDQQNQTEHTVNTVDEEAHVQHFSGKQTMEEINRKLYLLHAATGHTSVRNMVQALERRHADPRVLEAARNFKCSVCQEKQKSNTKRVASLEPLPQKFEVIVADEGKWHHPETNEEYQFVVIIDEGSRYRVARIMKQGRKQTISAAQFLGVFA